MSIQLRENHDSDFEALYQLDQECYEPGIAYSRRTLRAFLNEPGVFCRIAEETGEERAGTHAVARGGARAGTQAGATVAKLLGFVIAQQQRRQGHIITLDVPEAHRRRGIGSLLLRDVEQRLCGAGVREVELETAVDNATAVAFWKKHGYCTCGVIERYYAGKTDAYSMSKILPRTSAAKS